MCPFWWLSLRWVLSEITINQAYHEHDQSSQERARFGLPYHDYIDKQSEIQWQGLGMKCKKDQ